MTTTGVVGIANEAYEPVIRRVRYSRPGFKARPGWISHRPDDGLPHVPVYHLRLVRKAVELANSLKPDLTVLTGDYVWRIPEGAEDLAAILIGIGCPFGVYSVLGNHDIWLDVDLVLAGFCPPPAADAGEPGYPDHAGKCLALPGGSG